MIDSEKLPYASSELILSSEGTIYHLDLFPHQLGDIVITVGDPGRVPMVAHYLEHIEFTKHHREFVSTTGILGRHRVTVCSTGIGTDNIDIMLNELDALANIDFITRQNKLRFKSLSIVRLGTCGALQPDIALDTKLISASAVGFDNLMQFYKFEQGPEMLLFVNKLRDHVFGSSSPVKPYLAQSSELLISLFGHGFERGITATCPGFFAPQGRQLRAAVRYPNFIDLLTSFRDKEDRITNFEMETSGMYALCHLLAHRCLSISTCINNRATGELSSNMKAGIEDLIGSSLEIIKGTELPI
jgi:uridine phosphorylase